MNVVILLWRARLRTSWRSAVVLVLLLGLGGAVALSVAAGARRTASANDTILRSTNASDIAASYGSEDPGPIEAAARAIEGVADVNLWVGYVASPPRNDRGGFFSLVGYWQDPVAVSRPVITAGRLPTGPNEAMANELAAKRLGLAPGGHLEMSLADARGSFADPRKVRVDIVGVGLMADEVIEDELGAKQVIFVPRAFSERNLDRSPWGKVRVHLAAGADRRPVVAALAAKGMFVDELLDEDRARVQDAIRPLVMTLAGLAALAATATIVVTGQSITRLLRRRRADDRSLRAIGCATRHLVGADLLHAATIAFGGGVLAACLAVLASPLFPVGPAQRTGLFDGVVIDLVAVSGGAALLSLSVVAMVGLGSWRRRTAAQSIPAGRAPVALSSRVAAATGVRLVTAQRGIVMTLLGVASGLAVLVAAVTFTGSLGHLIDDPRLVGLSWDVGGRAAFDSVDLARVRSVVERDPAVARATGLSYRSIEANGIAVPLAIVDTIKGSPWPPLVAGRLPMASDEALVGRATLADLKLRIGDTLTVAIPTVLATLEGATKVSQTFRVVGSVVAPAIGVAGTDTPKLDTGIVLSSDALNLPDRSSFVTVVLFDLTRGTKPDEVITRFPRGLPVALGTPTEWFTSATPAEIGQANSARAVIWASVGALAVAIVGTIAHTLLASVRQRRRNYAVLKALGFTRRQVRTTVLCQSGALLGMAIAVALPVGIAAGRWLWTGFARGLGIVAAPRVPVLLLSGSVLVTVALVQGAALVPAALARRTPLANSLRSE